MASTSAADSPSKRAVGDRLEAVSDADVMRYGWLVCFLLGLFVANADTAMGIACCLVELLPPAFASAMALTDVDAGKDTDGEVNTAP